MCGERPGGSGGRGDEILGGALDALLNITDQYVRTKRHPADSIVPVMLDDRHTGLLRDYSSIWAGGLSSQHDNP